MFLTTDDGVKIAYDFFPSTGSGQAPPKGYFVLIHTMPTTKESWKDFAEHAKAKGYSSIAIDLRGHGQSAGGPDGYEQFTDAEHQRGIVDIHAAVEFLFQQGATSDKIWLIGASIGANLSLWYLSEHKEFPGVILLSPGFNYRGVQAGQFYDRLWPGQKVMVVTARDDKDNNARMNETMFGGIPAEIKKELVVFDDGGHGTDMFKKHPELKNKILEFISQ